MTAPVLRPHQRAAVDAATEALAAGGTALVTMACGTGKTLVGAQTATELAARTVLVAVPSLALAEQTAAVWRDAHPSAELLAVCTEGALSGVASTTDPAAVADWLAGPGMRVVVATYHSSAVIAAAQGDHGAAVFDLVVADEAHHLAGPPPGPFGAIIRGEVAAVRRLLLTATPRTFRRRQGDFTSTGMDDEDVYGPRVYDLRLGAAIDAGLVADYKVVVAVVTRAEVDAAARTLVGTAAASADVSLLAGAVATLRTMGELDLRRVVSFHSRVGRAHVFASLLGALAAALPEGSRPDGAGWVGWLYGGSGVRRRHELLASLAAGGDAWGLVANARCLGEGVDIPALDAVVIADPRTSEVDVTQAVGRVLRRSGDKTGVVVLPVVLDEPTTTDPTAADPTFDERSVALAAGVLRALRDHDDRLAERLDRARRDRGRRDGERYAAGEAAYRAEWRHRLADVVDVRLPPGAATRLAQAVTVRLVEGATAVWDTWYGLLEGWVETNGSAAVPRPASVTGPDGADWKLGVWVSTQRTRHRQGLLPLEREAALEALPGWEWEPLDAAFAAQVAALADWMATTGETNPSANVVHAGVKVGQAVNVWRSAYKDGVLAAERVATLEALSGWVWNMRDAWWEEHFAQLAGWVAAHGHACPPRGTFVDGFDLNRWVTKQRAKLRAGELDADQADRLRALPGWVDHLREGPWWQTFDLLCVHVAATGAQPSQSASVDGVALGNWAAKQRSRHRAGRLEPERVAALETVPGWSWAPRTERDAFGTALARLDTYVAAHGHARVPNGFRADDGFALGAWVTTKRCEHRQGKLSPERVATLEARPGWCWSTHDARFDDGIADLAAFVADHGRLPGPNERARAGEVDLGEWVRRRRNEHRSGRLSPERVAALEAVPGWGW